jgi:hypothetical protein
MRAKGAVRMQAGIQQGATAEVNKLRMLDRRG